MSLKALLKDKLKEVEPEKFDDEPMKVSDGIMPRVHFTGEQLDELDDWEVGEEYYIVAKVKLVNKHEDEGKVDGDFEVQEVCALDEENDESDED